jgi:small-conductance mechanosensitive channel
MITLGSSGVVNQLMSGLVLVYSRALRVGDHVVVGKDSDAVEGVVQEVGTLATKLKTMRNEEITIPNAVLVSNPIRNYSRLSATQGTMMATKVTIGYDAPWRQVHALLLKAPVPPAGLRQKPRALCAAARAERLLCGVRAVRVPGQAAGAPCRA